MNMNVNKKSGSTASSDSGTLRTGGAASARSQSATGGGSVQPQAGPSKVNSGDKVKHQVKVIESYKGRNRAGEAADPKGRREAAPKVKDNPKAGRSIASTSGNTQRGDVVKKAGGKGKKAEGGSCDAPRSDSQGKPKASSLKDLTKQLNRLLDDDDKIVEVSKADTSVEDNFHGSGFEAEGSSTDNDSFEVVKNKAQKRRTR